MLCVYLDLHRDPPRLILSEDEFLSWVDDLAARAFNDVPPGKVAVEALDEQQRVQWRSHYTNASGLVMLARQIREGRAALDPGSRAARP